MKISRRDRNALILLGGAAVLFFLFQFGLNPLLAKRERLERGITTRHKAVAEMTRMQETYRQTSLQDFDLQKRLADRKAGFSLFSFLEQAGAANGVKDSIAYMKPSEITDETPFKQTAVEMKLQAITLPQLVSFLEDVESPKNIVAVKRISVQENKKTKATLDVIMQVVSIDKV